MIALFQKADFDIEKATCERGPVGAALVPTREAPVGR